MAGRFLDVDCISHQRHQLIYSIRPNRASSSQASPCIYLAFYLILSLFVYHLRDVSNPNRSDLSRSLSPELALPP
jgi:hypothetical protein